MLSTLRHSSISSTPECKPRGLEGRKARRFKVKQPGASSFEGAGTAVSTLQSDAERLLRMILPSDSSGTKFVDLGSGPGMIVAVAAEILADGGGSVYGIEHQEILCEQSEELLRKHGLKATIIRGDLCAFDKLPIAGLTHPICQSNGCPPLLQFAIWKLLLLQSTTIQKIAIGIGNANQFAPFYDFFYKDNLNGAGKTLRSGVRAFIPRGKTQAIHVIDTDELFWDELQEYVTEAEREALEAEQNGTRYFKTFAGKACWKLKKHQSALKKRLEDQNCNPLSLGKRKRTPFRPVNVTRAHVRSKKGTF